MPRHSIDLPATLRRSPAKAQRLYRKTLQSAERQYGPGERAGRTAFAALKHSFEKVGDHWEEKTRPGPSDSRAQQSTADKRRGMGETFGGVDVLGHTRKELYERARRLGIRGRSKMNKEALARAIASSQD
jgi:cation transport regulator ChaB